MAHLQRLVQQPRLVQLFVPLLPHLDNHFRRRPVLEVFIERLLFAHRGGAAVAAFVSRRGGIVVAAEEAEVGREGEEALGGGEEAGGGTGGEVDAGGTDRGLRAS